jgi:hypothetical protein
MSKLFYYPYTLNTIEKMNQGIYKTLIGKNNYLFLVNDSNNEISVHNDNLDLLDNNFYTKLENYKNKYLLIVFPNKSLLCKQYLPDIYNLQYRPAFDKYKKYLGNNILDGYDILKDEDDVFYKTDTHLNFKGAYIIYRKFIEKINNLFSCNISFNNTNIIKKQVNSLLDICQGLGDLTHKNNAGDQKIEDTSDNFYYSNDIKNVQKDNIKINMNDLIVLEFKDNILIDKTIEYENSLLTWEIMCNYILYTVNNNMKYKVLIFYDSFLVSTLVLYLRMFNMVYMSKSSYNIELIELIKPDYIFEFRVERFLTH